MKIVNGQCPGGIQLHYGRHIVSYGRHVGETEEVLLDRFWAICFRQEGIL